MLLKAISLRRKCWIRRRDLARVAHCRLYCQRWSTGSLRVQRSRCFEGQDERLGCIGWNNFKLKMGEHVEDRTGVLMTAEEGRLGIWECPFKCQNSGIIRLKAQWNERRRCRVLYIFTIIKYSLVSSDSADALMRGL